jgi:hypothetical protein
MGYSGGLSKKSVWTTNTVRPEPVEGFIEMMALRLRQAQPERDGLIG